MQSCNSTDKPIVERDVQTIREELEKMIVKNPSIKISELNTEIQLWIKNNYGQRKHGTTQQNPMNLFLLKRSLFYYHYQENHLKHHSGKKQKVHPDHFIQVNCKAYSVPHAYVGKNSMGKGNWKFVYVLLQRSAKKQHLHQMASDKQT